MTAWERENRLMAEAQPTLREEDEQTWNAIDALERHQETLIRMQWFSRVPGSGAPERLMVAAVQALENRGMRVPDWEHGVDEALAALDAGDTPRLIQAHVRHLRRLAAAEIDRASPYWHFERYDDWERFEAASTLPPADRYAADSHAYLERVHAGWIGQIVGGALGTSIEGYTAEKLREAYGDIRGYLTKPSTFNDDITFELAFLRAADERGRDLTARDIAAQWVSLIPFGWSAEMVALRNLEAGIVPPESALRGNPFSEWIGAQMRGAVCGLVAPGNAREAARLAWMDGTISHENNGIIGEVFNAVLVSRAFVVGDMRRLVEETVAALPPKSEYAAVVSFALESCKRSSDWAAAWAQCEERYRRYNWVHAYPNACAEVVALWFGEGDFDETLHIIAMEGQDVDCNAAQIMTAVAVAKGAGAIDRRWTDPIGDTLHTYVRTMKEMSIRELAQWTVRVAERLA
ncbi:MAG: ADP-ribosylglycohydrolase family protein [Spirochaetales bacterium]|nr:ADP-ribosylglycohydrolase family protein [Spirochaetales bacterium]